MTTEASTIGVEQDAQTIVGPEADGLAEKVWNLFALSDEVVACESEREVRLSRLGIEFLRAKYNTALAPGDGFAGVIEAGLPAALTSLRAAIANPLTTEADIDAVLADQLQLSASLN
ncbi:MAG: hypothetical protein WCD76_13475 [Pyrinomonadaceae bacterium]